MLEFAWPALFLALPLPLLVFWLAPARKERVQAVRVAFFESLAKGMETGEGAVVPRRSAVQMVVAALAWVLVIIVLARPQWVGEPIERTVAARDVMLAIDLSGSMDIRDFKSPDGAVQSRLDAVKDVVGDFIDKRDGDRLGLVVFGTKAYVQVPFTQDLETARLLLENTAPAMAGPNTAIGDAIGVAIRSFEASDIDDRLLIVLSDGADTGSRMSPDKAARIASSHGVTIHTIAVGDPKAEGDDKVDVAALQRIAEIGGGNFYLAQDRAQLDEVYGQLDALDPRETETRSWRPRIDLGWWAAAAFVGLFLLSYMVALAAGVFRGRAA